MKTKLKKIIGSILLMALFISFIPTKVLAEAAVKLQALFVDQQYSYVDLYELSPGGLITVRKDNKYVLIDKKGQEVESAQYDYISGFLDGIAVVRQNNKYGYINGEGDLVIPIKYYSADPFFNGLARVSIKDSNGKIRCGYINKNGDEVIPLIYSSIHYLIVNGYTIATTYDETTKKSTYYLVNTSGLSKKIDGTSASIVAGKYLKVVNSDEYTYYDFNGNKLNFSNDKNAWISNDLMMLNKDGKYGYIDEQGKEVIPFDYIKARPFDYTGIAIVEKEQYNYYGIDKSGKTVIQPNNYTNIMPFSTIYNKYYIVYKLDENQKVKEGCVDYQGNLIIPAIYDSINSNAGFINGLIAVSNDKKKGFVDLKGNLVVPTIYDEVGNFSDELAAVQKDGKWGFIDTQGNLVISFQYDDVNKDGFKNSMASVVKDGKAGAIDKSGNTIVPFEYNNVKDIYIMPEGLVWTAKYDAATVKTSRIRSYSLFEINKTAELTHSAVLVDGKSVPFEAFTIDGSNYFKLRDIAKVLNGSDKQVEIGWDDAANSITITIGKGYTAVGGELSVSGNTENKSASITNSKILLNGKEIKLQAYQINGSNYFKLRDLAAFIDFGITWDEGTSTIGIDTSSGYKK